MPDYDIVDQVLATESGRIGDDILQRTLHTSPEMTLVKEGVWPEGMGETIKVLSWSRTLPINAGTSKAERPSWEDVQFSSDTVTGTGGACIPPVTSLPIGYSTAEYNLEQLALESPRLCVTDLMNSFKRVQSLNAIRKGLADATNWVMIQKVRQFFTSLCSAQILVCNAATGGAIESTTMTSGSGKTPGAPTNALLLRCYQRLIRRGAGNSTPLKDNGAPVFPLITSGEVSRLLKVESNYRDDYRWNAAKVGELLAALGASSSPVNGFQHIISTMPDRWNYTGGQWVWVPPYKLSGNLVVENEDYETAAWEDTYIFHPDVFDLVFPGSIGDAGGGASFNPVKYRGEWSWKNIPHETTNPDGTIGFFRGVFMLGGKPNYTDYGYVIRHARCDLGALYGTCA